MAALGKLRTMQDNKVAFMCPGCKELHALNLDKSKRPCWDFNDSFFYPTFTPSINVKGENVPFVCHSYVTDGKIKFLNDCTHSLKGQTVGLPDVETKY